MSSAVVTQSSFCAHSLHSFLKGPCQPPNSLSLFVFVCPSVPLSHSPSLFLLFYLLLLIPEAGLPLSPPHFPILFPPIKKKSLPELVAWHLSHTSPLFKKLQHICVPSWFFSWRDLLGTRRHYLREPVFVYPAYWCSSNPTLCVCVYIHMSIPACVCVCVLLAWMCSVFYICRWTGEWVYLCMCVCAYRDPMLMLVVFEDSTLFFFYWNIIWLV